MGFDSIEFSGIFGDLTAFVCDLTIDSNLVSIVHHRWSKFNLGKYLRVKWADSDYTKSQLVNGFVNLFDYNR